MLILYDMFSHKSTLKKKSRYLIISSLIDKSWTYPICINVGSNVKATDISSIIQFVTCYA